MRIVLFAIVFVFISGCAPKVSQSNLYWGNYSNTLYALKKAPVDDTKAAHEAELEGIVAKSKELNLKVPPGIYAELGLFALERGDKSSAQNYFGLEQESYPESAILMEQTLKTKID
ncbi:MAG: DUF4810 domain-containing protein [Gammaproteobacteria bacterium]|nr:DUF4810 domain-containing protein [Gammaproteobacteria bacterium]